MPKRASQGLEAQLAELTGEFVARLVEAIRNASFGDVAALSVPRVRAKAVRPGPTAHAPTVPDRPSGRHGTRSRQTAARRAELGHQVVGALESAGRPVGVRVLSSELGVAPDLLATPLRELRAAGRIRKHGEKRATTYSIA